MHVQESMKVCARDGESDEVSELGLFDQNLQKCTLTYFLNSYHLSEFLTHPVHNPLTFFFFFSFSPALLILKMSNPAVSASLP